MHDLWEIITKNHSLKRLYNKVCKGKIPFTKFLKQVLQDPEIKSYILGLATNEALESNQMSNEDLLKNEKPPYETIKDVMNRVINPFSSSLPKKIPKTLPPKFVEQMLRDHYGYKRPKREKQTKEHHRQRTNRKDSHRNKKPAKEEVYVRLTINHDGFRVDILERLQKYSRTKYPLKITFFFQRDGTLRVSREGIQIVGRLSDKIIKEIIGGGKTIIKKITTHLAKYFAHHSQGGLIIECYISVQQSNTPKKQASFFSPATGTVRG